jgi:predicted ATPase
VNSREASRDGEPLPSGTVTFAFAEIALGADRRERASDAMRAATRRCDAILRDAIATNGGHIARTFGDTTCAAFARPAGAIAAAIDAQRALAREDFSDVGGLAVRFALHTGSADPLDGEHVGPASHRTAALLELARGGQVLVSGVTRELVRDALPPGASLRDLGERRLEDLTRPERVFSLVAPGLVADFSPLGTIDAPPNNLPRSLTSFVGREADVAAIATLLASNRLICLVGAGGIGKTRTSLAVAARDRDAVDGVWFVELAPLASGAYVASTIAQAMGLALGPGDRLALLVRALASKRVLFVLDNCEHVRDDAALVVAALLHGCADVKILATSRQALEVAGERNVRLEPLGLEPADDLTRAPSVALFVERARSADARFEPTPDALASIAEICRRLDGIPLAIELAAARVRVLSPRELQGRLDERFRLLTAGDRAALPRQQTLRALMDWSYDLLDERERALFRRLAIFANGFAFEGALAVGTGPELDDFEALDVLGSLVDKSLVVTDRTGDDLRYRLLESTRVYAREKLVASGERDACADRHLRYVHELFVAVRERCEATARRAELHEAIARELDDVRAALDRAVGGGDAVLGAYLLAESSGRAWASLGLTDENRARARALLAVLPDAEPAAAALLSVAIAFVEANDGRRSSALEATTYAVACARTCANPRILAQALLAHARQCATQPNFEDDAEAAIRDVEALLPDLPREFRVRTLHETAFASMRRGAHAAAERAYENLRDEHRALGNAALVDLATLNLAEVVHAAGRTPEAIAMLRDALPGFRARPDRQIVITVLANLAGYCASIDDFAAASEAAREIVRELGAREPTAAFVGIAIEHLALALALGGEIARAALLHGYADAAIRTSGFERLYTETTTRDRLTALLAARLAPDELARLQNEGAALEPERAVRSALATDAIRDVPHA